MANRRAGALKEEYCETKVQDIGKDLIRIFRYLAGKGIPIPAVVYYQRAIAGDGDPLLGVFAASICSSSPEESRLFSIALHY